MRAFAARAVWVPRARANLGRVCARALRRSRARHLSPPAAVDHPNLNSTSDARVHCCPGSDAPVAPTLELPPPGKTPRSSNEPRSAMLPRGHMRPLVSYRSSGSGPLGGSCSRRWRCQFVFRRASSALTRVWQTWSCGAPTHHMAVPQTAHALFLGGGPSHNALRALLRGICSFGPKLKASDGGRRDLNGDPLRPAPTLLQADIGAKSSRTSEAEQPIIVRFRTRGVGRTACRLIWLRAGCRPPDPGPTAMFSSFFPALWCLPHASSAR